MKTNYVEMFTNYLILKSDVYILFKTQHYQLVPWPSGYRVGLSSSLAAADFFYDFFVAYFLFYNNNYKINFLS